MNPIAIFYHCLFALGDPPVFLPNAVNIITDQMDHLKQSGLEDAATEIIVGINGGEESRPIARLLLPSKAKLVMHGLQCRNECRTILTLEQWLPGHEDWYVLWFHSKGATKPPGDPLATRWRQCMTRHCIFNWRKCVSALDGGYDVAGAHYMHPPATPPGQHIMAGNFWFAKASFLLNLPSIMKRERIKQSGIDALESRFESEVWLGNGPRLPKIKDYHEDWNPSKWATCQP